MSVIPTHARTGLPVLTSREVTGVIVDLDILETTVRQVSGQIIS